jgi:prevent-host-death family protein
MTTMGHIHEAKMHFSKLIERVRQGEEIVIAKAGQPVARLVPETRRRQPGTGKGQIVIHQSFYDDLPEELLDLFEGQERGCCSTPMSCCGGSMEIRASQTDRIR